MPTELRHQPPLQGPNIPIIIAVLVLVIIWIVVYKYIPAYWILAGLATFLVIIFITTLRFKGPPGS